MRMPALLTLTGVVLPACTDGPDKPSTTTTKSTSSDDDGGGDGGFWAVGEQLYAVRIAGDASLIVAVGQSGAVVRIGKDDIAVQELLDPALSLRALHLSHTHGHAVGDDGLMFATHDLGRTWEPMIHGLDHDLLGLDDLHGEPHL